MARVTAAARTRPMELKLLTPKCRQGAKARRYAPRRVFVVERTRGKHLNSAQPLCLAHVLASLRLGGLHTLAAGKDLHVARRPRSEGSCGRDGTSPEARRGEGKPSSLASWRLGDPIYRAAMSVRAAVVLARAAVDLYRGRRVRRGARFTGRRRAVGDGELHDDGCGSRGAGEVRRVSAGAVGHFAGDRAAAGEDRPGK